MDLLDNFLEFVRIDTQSCFNAKKYPSSDKQYKLGILCVSKLNEIGLERVSIDSHCIVRGYLPKHEECLHDDQIVLNAHLDTSPEESGVVFPVIHDYKSGDIILPKNDVVIPEKLLEEYKGCQIVTSDGSSLLGADDKAGISVIMDACQTLKKGNLVHPKICVVFTPDEEIGHGADHFPEEIIKESRAGYTLDGGEVHEGIEDETFSAYIVTVKLNGMNWHPGYGKDKLVNSMRAAAYLMTLLPRDEHLPEKTEKRQPFIHPINIVGGVGESVIQMLIRGFTQEDVDQMTEIIETAIENTKNEFPLVNISHFITEQYNNMKEMIALDPLVIELALEAMKECGIEPNQTAIRGGTDGARLSFMGLPCPNLFAGGSQFHSRMEFLPVESMKKSSQVVVKLMELWGKQH